MTNLFARPASWPARERSTLKDAESNAIIVAALRSHGGIVLTASELISLHPRLAALRTAGWDALEVAQRLAADPAPVDVRSPVGLIAHRIEKHLGGAAVVTHAYGATALRITRAPAALVPVSRRPVDRVRQASDYPESIF